MSAPERKITTRRIVTVSPEPTKIAARRIVTVSPEPTKITTRRIVTVSPPPKKITCTIEHDRYTLGLVGVDASKLSDADIRRGAKLLAWATRNVFFQGERRELAGMASAWHAWLDAHQ